MQVDLEYYRKQFYIEATEILEKVNEEILKVESEPDNSELLNSIFRGIHTIKGSAGSFELHEISQFAHHLEGLLDSLRNGQIIISSEIVDIVLNGIDQISKMIEDYKSGNIPVYDKDIIEKFKKLSDNDNKKSESEKNNKNNTAKVNDTYSLKPEIKNELEKFTSEGYNFFEVFIKYSDEEYSNGYDPIILLKNLKEKSVYFKSECNFANIPSIKDFNPLKLYLQPRIYIATDLTRDEVIDLAIESSLIEVYQLNINETDITLLPFEEIDKENIKEFMIDASEAIETIEQHLIAYENENSLEALNAIFRAVHTLKGDADYIGLKMFAGFTHSLESVLQALKTKKLGNTGPIMDTILKSIDYLKIVISNLQSNKGYPLEIEQLRKRLQSIIEDSKEHNVPEELREIYHEQLAQYLNILKINLSNQPVNENNIKAVKRALNDIKKASLSVGNRELASLAEDVSRNINENTDDTIKNLLDKTIVTITQLISDNTIKIDKNFSNSIFTTLEVPSVPNESSTNSSENKEKEVVESINEHQKTNVSVNDKTTTLDKARPEEAKVMRVDEYKIDSLGNIIGELAVTQTTYEYLINQLSHANGNGIDRSILKGFKDNFYQISRLSKLLQASVMSIRMIPIKLIFQKFTRVVRDIARKQGKQIELIIQGEDTEIDKKVADKLSDPLLHIIRNACDHGIESPLERREKGKPEQGTVILTASQEGGNLIIKIADDGHGIDREKLFKKALSSGYVQYKSKDDPDLVNLIFLPGISTKDNVSDISGRGVGMDVVKTTVDILGGKVYVNTQEGWGTEITLLLPTSVGIINTLIVESNNNVYAIPLEYVVETIKVPSNLLKNILDGLGLYYRGSVIPCEYLSVLLYQKRRTLYIQETNISELSIVILKSQAGKFGLIVDKLHKNTEIAVKSSPESLSKIEIISGVSILGDGRVILVLNPEKLV